MKTDSKLRPAGQRHHGNAEKPGGFSGTENLRFRRRTARFRQHTEASSLWTDAQFVHTIVMRVEWSRAKAAANLLKHRVDFAIAAEALNDVYAVTVEDGRHEEERYFTVAMSPTGEVLVVVYAFPDEDTIRIISARKASRSERNDYFEGRRHEH